MSAPSNWDMVRWLAVMRLPLIGAIVLLVFVLQDDKPGGNQYGANPKDVTA